MSGAPATRTVTQQVTLDVICDIPMTPEGLSDTSRDTGQSVLMALGRKAEVPQPHDTSLLEDTLVTMCQVVAWCPSVPTAHPTGVSGVTQAWLHLLPSAHSLLPVKSPWSFHAMHVGSREKGTGVGGQGGEGSRVSATGHPH